MHQFLNVYWVEEGGALNHYGLYPLFHKTIEPAHVRRLTFGSTDIFALVYGAVCLKHT